MQKWEYRTIEVIKGRVNQVNGQLSYKVLPKGLSSGQPYTIDEYLSVIGEEGWEIVGCGTKALLYMAERSVDNADIIALIAKRPIQRP
jgi:hypothetical protein